MQDPNAILPLPRPVVVSNPLSGAVTLVLGVDHEGIRYLVGLAYNRSDAGQPVMVELSPDPADEATAPWRALRRAGCTVAPR